MTAQNVHYIILIYSEIYLHLHSLCGHAARLPEDTPFYQALWCHIDLSLGHLPDPSWGWCPGRPRNRWLHQLCRDNGTPPADLWRRAVRRGHLGWH